MDSAIVMTDPDLRQLVESNARTAEAILDALAQAQKEREALKLTLKQMTQALSRDIAQLVATQQDAESERPALRQAMLKMAKTQGDMIRVLASLSEDRPVLINKLTTIMETVDQLLDQDSRDCP